MKFSKKISLFSIGVFSITAFFVSYYPFSSFSPAFSSTLSPNVQLAEASTWILFTVNLQQGDSGLEVLELQEALNLSKDTQVATQGVGSPGDETNYFGTATQAAVTRFQNKYAAEVLTPVGLTSGNGFFGPLTRQEMNLLLGTNTTSALTASATSATNVSGQTSSSQPATLPGFASIDEQQISSAEAQQSQDPSDLNILYQTTRSALAGSAVSLYGSGFASSTDPSVLNGTRIYLGANIVSGATLSDGVKLTFTVPNLPYGKYTILVTNENGTSNSDHFLVITDPSLLPPTISSVSPESFSYGQPITIIGQNFTPTNNEVWTQFGNFDGLPSPDGKTITFTFSTPPFTQLQQIKDGGANVPDISIPFYVNVVNNGGATTVPGEFMLNITKQQ